MKKVALLFISLLLTQNAFADEVSDECLQSMQSVYKFYYHEILPKDNLKSPKLSASEAEDMENVITELKENCPQEVVAKMNHFLQAETQQG